MLIGDRENAVVIDHRFQGLPEVAHGGYVAGLMARALGARGVEVRLRRPVRTGRALRLERRDGGAAELLDGEALLAEAAPAAPEIAVPRPVSMLEASAAARRFLGAEDHPAPGCVVCGTEREAGDGLRVFPGPVAGRRLVAAPWTPPAELADEAGAVPPELVSAAFDCAQLWALIAHAPPGTRDLVLTAGLELVLGRPVLAGQPHVLVGWPIGREGRAWLAGAALFALDGELCAAGRQRAALASWGLSLGRSRPPEQLQPSRPETKEETDDRD